MKMPKCPVCGQFEFAEEGDYDICDVCGWENDIVNLRDPDFPTGANYMSLNEYRAKWHKQQEEIRRAVPA